MPAEVHEHFNAVGHKTGHTVVHRESVWDDSSRERAMQFIEHEQSLDPRTMLPYSEAYKAQQFVVTDLTNYAEQAIEKQRRADEAEAKSKGYADGWNDGRRYVVRPATPDEIQQGRADPKE